MHLVILQYKTWRERLLLLAAGPINTSREMKSFLPRPAHIPSTPLLCRWAPQGAGHVGVIDKQCACAEGVRRVCEEGGLLEEVACLSQREKGKGESTSYSAITPREDPATRVRSCTSSTSSL